MSRDEYEKRWDVVMTCNSIQAGSRKQKGGKMKRPPLTWKAIRNLESLWGFAEGEIANYHHDKLDPITKDARDAIEWIKRLRRWKTEQDELRKEAK
jgi:hypothetical protein